MKIKSNRHFVSAVCIASIFYSASSMAADAFDFNSPWLLGDWGGYRNELSENGMDFFLNYSNEAASNIGGGYNSHSTVDYSDQTVAILNYDLNKTDNVNGVFSVAISNRNNKNLLNNNRLNDPRGTLTEQSQEIWGGGSVTRLARLTYIQRANILGQNFSLRVGKMSPAEDFFPTSCEFQSLMNCGTVPGISGIWYGWPVASWSAVTTWNITPDLYIRTGVYQKNPSDNTNARAQSLSFKGGTGEIYPTLIGWTPRWGSNNLAGNYFIGVAYSNVNGYDVYEGASGGVEALNPDKGYKQHNNKLSAWARFEQQVTGHSGDQPQGLTLFANGVLNDKSTTVLQYAYGGGLYYRGPFESRPDDLIGLASTWVKINSRWSKNRAIANSLSGISDYDNPAYIPPGSGSLTTEIFYRWQATDWISFQPNLQYYHSPGGVKNVPDAWVVGLRSSITF